MSGERKPHRRIEMPTYPKRLYVSEETESSGEAMINSVRKVKR